VYDFYIRILRQAELAADYIVGLHKSGSKSVMTLFSCIPDTENNYAYFVD
jgi:hypothetical protein